MATMRERQSRFAAMAARLILRAIEMGYEVTLGDAYRDTRLHGYFGQQRGYGAAKSYHKLRLAIDLNLFKDGVYLQDTEAYQPLGSWWRDVEGGTWGGDFSKPDGNHFSLGEGQD